MKMKLFPIVALTLGLWSCGGNGETEKPAEETAEPVTEEAASADQGAGIIDMADFQFHTMIANLPSPLETFHLISDVSVGMEGVPLTLFVIISLGPDLQLELNTGVPSAIDSTITCPNPSHRVVPSRRRSSPSPRVARRRSARRSTF